LEFLPSEFDALIRPLFDGCLIELNLGIVDVLLLVALEAVVDADGFDFDLLDLELEVALLGGKLGFDVVVDARRLGSVVVGEAFFGSVVEFPVLLLVVGCSVHVALEFEVVGGRPLDYLGGFNVFGRATTVLVVSAALPWVLRLPLDLGVDVEIGS
jgi:hypothetical protein